ncbi:MAG: hypothetical protein M3134_01980 [Actinomycetota bacterium]|nr:hypothetical protein [Actinomycetota bacterium]
MLAVDVHRSELGPYMVTAYGQHRYFHRTGTSTYPMNEQQVRDAYAAAIRSTESRAALWRERRLPVQPPSGLPWLATCGIPMGQIGERLDPSQFPMRHLDPENVAAVLPEHAAAAGLTAAMRLAIWADGIYGEEVNPWEGGVQTLMRIHRDGSAMTAVQLERQIDPWQVARGVNAQLAYLAGCWEAAGVLDPIELDLRIVNILNAPIADRTTSGKVTLRQAHRPVSGPEPQLALRREVLLRQLQRASVRHGLVLDFTTRLYNVYNFDRSRIFSSWGYLYGPDGPLGIAIGGRHIWTNDGRAETFVDSRGGIQNRGGFTVAFFVDGVVLDLKGRALGVLEMAPGAGVPDDFFPVGVPEDPRFRAPGGAGDPTGANHDLDPPAPLGEWSEENLMELVRATERRE